MSRKLPTEIKKARGTYRGSREIKNQPVLNKVSTLTAPGFLNDFAKDEWDRIIPELVDSGVLAEVDAGALAMAMIQYGIAVEAYASIYTYEDDEGKTKNRTLKEYLDDKSKNSMTEIVVLYKAYDAYKKMIVEFGLTPVSRTKIEVQKDVREVNEFEQFK